MRYDQIVNSCYALLEHRTYEYLTVLKIYVINFKYGFDSYKTTFCNHYINHI